MDSKNSSIMSSGINAELKSRQHYCQTLPNIVKNNDSVELKTKTASINVTVVEESIFLILAEYKFMPVWLALQFLSYNSFAGENLIDIIKSWVNFGLVWCENTITGEYIRPTYLLFEIFNISQTRFNVIPFNLLTQMINEQSIIFDILTGNDNSVINKSFSKIYLSKFSPLGIGHKSGGTNVLYRSKLTTPAMYLKKSIDDVNALYSLVEENHHLSPEFKDLSLFTVMKKIKNTDIVKEAYKFKVPNLVIPILRENGMARSVGIEIEITNKSIAAYEKILDVYKDNKIYGYIVFLCSSSTIIKNIRNAYKKVGGLGHTKVYLFENEIPSPKTFL